MDYIINGKKANINWIKFLNLFIFCLYLYQDKFFFSKKQIIFVDKNIFELFLKNYGMVKIQRNAEINDGIKTIALYQVKVHEE